MDEVKSLELQAITYVWGWQDAKGEMDTDVSIRFGKAYAEHARKFAEHEISFRTNIGRAFADWSAGREIGSA